MAPWETSGRVRGDPAVGRPEAQPWIRMGSFRGLILAALFSLAFFQSACGAPAQGTAPSFPKPLEEYHDEQIPGVLAKLGHRIRSDRFNLVGTVLFLRAIVHTFFASKLMQLSHRLEHRFHQLAESETGAPPNAPVLRERDRLQFLAQTLHFFGEVEAVFGIWLIPLFLAILVMRGWPTVLAYATHIDASEPVFVVVVMAIAGSRPVLSFAESCLAKVAGLGRATAAAWWLSILTVGPLLGSFITEPAAMTICALLLRRRFYDLSPSPDLSYATLALLFVNISLGGTLTHFAAPPVVMVATRWKWDLAFMFTQFGWKAVIGILVATAVYYLRFRKELTRLSERAGYRSKGAIGSCFGHRHSPPVYRVDRARVALPAPGGPRVAFLSGVRRGHAASPGFSFSPKPAAGRLFPFVVVIHGGCQQWWIEPLLRSLSDWPLMMGATLLTALNDNAAITYLASLVPEFSDGAKYAVVAGAVAGGGLTVIANAPNPAGQSILASRFGDEGISPLKLFVWALVPTLIMGAALMLLR
jgi:Putative Na+/H+ antiporter